MAGLFVKVPTAEGDAEMVATPVDFGVSKWSVESPAPELGQHSEEILLQLGMDWEEIARLKGLRVIP